MLRYRGLHADGIDATQVSTMSDIQYTSIEPFIPSGKDYDLARRFFSELGFVEQWENNGIAGFAAGNCRFMLQRYDNQEFANNLMMKLSVPDLDQWWGKVEALQLAARYVGVSFKPPTNFPWGREVNFIDPAGVCWHVMGSR